MINNGSKYLNSAYYPESKDHLGNYNNVFDPAKFNWTSPKKLKARQRQQSQRLSQQLSSTSKLQHSNFDKLFDQPEEDSITKSTRQSSNQLNSQYQEF